MEYTGIIKEYELNRVIIGSLILNLHPNLVNPKHRKRYPVGTRVRVEVLFNYIVSMIDAPVYQPFEQTTLTRLYIEQNSQADLADMKG